MVVANGIQTTPLVVGGLVIVADGNSIVYALDAQTGAKKWSFAAEVGHVKGLRTVHTLSVRDGLVYYFAPNCVLYGLKLETGDVKYSLKGIGENVPGGNTGYSGRAAPSFHDRSAIMGPAAGSGRGRGFIASYNLESQKLNWRWYSAPPPEEGPKNWDKEAYKGNIEEYPNDWGTSALGGQTSIWGQTLVDEQAHRVYFGTGNSDLFQYDASLVPGPNLYAASIVALDASTGEMEWYHQTTPHDLVGWAVGWSVILADVSLDGVKKKAIIGAAKNNHVYVLDAADGKPVYEPVKVGHNEKLLNANLGNNADMTASLKPGVYVPSHFGGIESPIGFANNTIYVVSQRVPQEASYYDGTYRDIPVRRLRLVETEGTRYSTLYAIDAGRGEVKWSFFMPHEAHGASTTISGGVVYVVNRGGELYALDEQSGRPLHRLELGGLGTAGVSFGATKTGEMRLFVPASSGSAGPNKLMCFGLPR